MRAGQLTSTITISSRVEHVDEFGTPSDTWLPLATMRAQIVTRDARAFLAEAGEEIETSIVFRTYYRGGIEPGDRVTFEGREFELVELKEVVRRRVMELRCRERRP